jgi:ankyrin repeat protein
MIKAVKKNASAEDIALAECFPKAREEFKNDFAFSPILVAVLDLYDESDAESERPSLSELLDCASNANNAKSKDDWAALESKYEGKSTLFWQIIDRCRHNGTKIREYQDFLNENDAVHGWPAVYWAAYIGDLEKMKILLLKGATIRTITPSGRNIFHHAAESGNPNVISHLIECKYHEVLDISLPDLWKETPLHIAAAQDAKSVDLLLKIGAKVEAVQTDNQTPLHCASRADEKERPHIVKSLAEHDTNREAINVVDDGGLTPIFLFLRFPACLGTLVANGADIHVRDKQNRTLVHHACRQDQAESLKFLLEAGEFKWPILMQKDSEGVTPLDEAMSRGKADCAKMILEKLANITWDDNYAKHLLLGAARIGDPDLLEQVLGLKLLDEYSMVRRAGEARRAAAAESMDKGRVRELLDELNRRKGHIPREFESGASTAEARAIYFAMR